MWSSGEKSGNAKKSGKVKKAGSGKNSTSETHATVRQPRKIKQISQYPGTVKVKRDASNNVERVVELGEYLSLLNKGYYCETHFRPLVFINSLPLLTILHIIFWLVSSLNERDNFANGKTYAYIGIRNSF